ncbi:hypothetical protein ABMA75_09660 [Halobacteriovorax sp. ZH4_bin.1]|uniref:hypothetical protein n=2 Tax=unclassified Halobacteriovorax TaxID=2639665 RepID=UPI00371905AF
MLGIMIEKYFRRLRAQYPVAFLSDARLSLLLENIHSEEELKIIFSYLQKHLKSSPSQKENGELLFSLIDKTQYSVRAWIEAILTFDSWLKENERETDFKTMIGYIECSTLSPENKILKYQLKELVGKMLNEFGYVG